MSDDLCENCQHPIPQHTDAGCSVEGCECFFPPVPKVPEPEDEKNSDSSAVI